MEQSLRLFYALEIPEETRRELEKFGVTLEKPWRAVNPEQMHITLAYMGNVPQAKLDEVIKTGDEAALVSGAFTVELSDSACFPDNGEPKVLYAKADGGEGLGTLAEALRSRLGDLADQKKIKAHLTIARCRSGWARKILRKFRGSWPVASFALFKSTISEDGPRYELIKRFQLK